MLGQALHNAQHEHVRVLERSFRREEETGGLSEKRERAQPLGPYERRQQRETFDGEDVRQVRVDGL